MAKLSCYLDSRKSGDKPAPLLLAVRCNNGAAYLPLNIRLHIWQWDPVKQLVIGDATNRKQKNLLIKSKMIEAERVLLALADEGRLGIMSARQVRDAIRRAFFGLDKGRTLFTVFDEVMSILKAENTRKAYVTVRNHLTNFLQGDDTPICSVNLLWVEKFLGYLRKSGLSDNSIVHSLAVFKRVLNYAFDNNELTDTSWRKVAVKSVATRKRSLGVDELRDVLTKSLKGDEAIARDLFALSFMLIGISPADLFTLQPPVDGYVDYKRHKTAKCYHLRVEPEARAIADKYRRPGLFVDCHSDNVKSFCFYTRRHLGKIKKGLTLYWARHTWATIAAGLEIPHDTIAACLGHSMGNPMTAIYIRFDTRKIDEANRKVLDFVLYGKK